MSEGCLLVQISLGYGYWCPCCVRAKVDLSKRHSGCDSQIDNATIESNFKESDLSVFVSQGKIYRVQCRYEYWLHPALPLLLRRGFFELSVRFQSAHSPRMWFLPLSCLGRKALLQRRKLLQKLSGPTSHIENLSRSQLVLRDCLLNRWNCVQPRCIASLLICYLLPPLTSSLCEIP